VLYLRGLSTGYLREALTSLLGEDASAGSRRARSLASSASGSGSTKAGANAIWAIVAMRTSSPTGRSTSGRRCARCGRRRRSDAAGCTEQRTYSTGCRSGSSGTPRSTCTDIFQAETKTIAQEEVEAFAKKCGDRYTKAVTTLAKDEEELFTFYDFPATHWQTIRSTNVIESAFATVRLRTRVTKGAGSRTRGLTMTFRLLAMAQKRWRKIRIPQVVDELMNGTKHLDGRNDSEDTAEARKSAA